MLKSLLAAICMVLFVTGAQAAGVADLKAAQAAAEKGAGDEAIRLFTEALAAGDLSADDQLIAPHHSQELARLLQAARVPVTLVMIQHDAHGLAVPTHGQSEDPSPDAVIHMIEDFFDWSLGA